MVKAPKSLALIFVAFAMLFGLWFWLQVSVNPDIAWGRFSILNNSGATARAIGHGEQTLALRRQEGMSDEDLAPLRYAVAIAQEKAGQPDRAVALYRAVLASEWRHELSDEKLFRIKASIAELELVQGHAQGATYFLTDFLDQAGDEASLYRAKKDDVTPSPQLQELLQATDMVAESLPPFSQGEILTGSEDEKLNAAAQMIKLGGFYAAIEGGQYAAAGLLNAAYQSRLAIYGPDHADVMQSILLLGPIYEKLGHSKDAERLYLEAVHAQENSKGPNNPDLSLYLRLLANVYNDQGRFTEAEALNIHIRNIFRDAFGVRRYMANQDRDRRMDLNRPVSVDFPLSADFKATDLVQAGDYSIPLSKPNGIAEMSIRLATEVSSDDSNMPTQLLKLINDCNKQTGEKLSLRSGYRSQETQTWLYNNTDHKGKVTRPGTSEHQLGLAVDIDVDYRLMRNSDRSYQCFESHAWEYGFILSYPQGNTYLDGPDTYEPWHWRYVGLQTALLYRETGPLNKPQEFLAALPCYEERAQAGLWSSAGESDVCLEYEVRGAPEKVVSPMPQWSGEEPEAASSGG